MPNKNESAGPDAGKLVGGSRSSSFLVERLSPLANLPGKEARYLFVPALLRLHDHWLEKMRALETGSEFARDAVAGRKQMMITHSEIFPGMFASTTETADYVLRELKLVRRPVLRWGPMGTQQLSEARAGKFLLLGYAGNTAPDHVDQLHALPKLLRMLK